MGWLPSGCPTLEVGPGGCNVVVRLGKLWHGWTGTGAGRGRQGEKDWPTVSKHWGILLFVGKLWKLFHRLAL